MHAHIPRKLKRMQKSSLPWLNDTCYQAINAKHEAERSTDYNEIAKHCRHVLLGERQKYMAQLRQKMESLPRSSKRWWSLNKQLLHKQAAPALFPPLKNKAGTWCRSPQSKANAFAECWTDKCKLPDERVELFFSHVSPLMSDWFPIRPRIVKKLLLALREDQATGPDGFAAIFLKKIAEVISVPLAILTRRIFNEAIWPTDWKIHHIAPLFKKGSRFLPGQYRGIHLTNILSKTVERVIGQPLVAFLEARGYGNSQWAFRKKSSARDLVTILAAKWVILICRGKKIGLYLSDISGAFDKVSRCLLMGKLAQIGLPPRFLDFLNAYLLPREGLVRVEGALSEVMALLDMVFQGTVLGPSLWNAFFADVADYVPCDNQEINLFADDLTVMTHKAQHTSDHLMFDELKEIQCRTHEWGVRNQVEFDPSKEFLKIIHPRRGLGDDFKMLGTLFDVALSMKPCIEYVLGRVRPKIRALLRLKDFYPLSVMLDQYKSHIWGITEYSNGVIFMAPPCQARRLDKLQRWYLRELGISDQDAFVTHNFAPPSLRRNIGLLGFLHKRVLGECHPALCQALPFGPPHIAARYHSNHLDTRSGEVVSHARLYERSLYAYIRVYNRLPQALADSPSVSCFQARLTHLAKQQAKESNDNWRKCFQDCRELSNMFDGH